MSYNPANVNPTSCIIQNPKHVLASSTHAFLEVFPGKFPHPAPKSVYSQAERQSKRPPAQTMIWTKHSKFQGPLPGWLLIGFTPEQPPKSSSWVKLQNELFLQRLGFHLRLWLADSRQTSQKEIPNCLAQSCKAYTPGSLLHHGQLQGSFQHGGICILPIEQMVSEISVHTEGSL